MSVFSRIVVRMNLNKADFDAKLKGSEKSLHAFSSQLSRVGLGRLSPFAALTAGIAAFHSGLEKVRQSDAMDEQTRKNRAYVASLDEAKSILSGINGLLVTGARHASNFVGDVMHGTIGFVTGGFSGAEDAVNANRKYKEELGRSRELDIKQKEIDKRRKEAANELARIQDRLAAIQKRRQEHEISQLDLSKQIELAEGRIAKAKKEATDHNLSANENLEAAVRFEEELLNLSQLRLKVEAEAQRKAVEDKRNADKLADDEKKAAEALQKAQQNLAEAEHTHAYDQMKMSDQIADLQRRIADLRASGNRETVKGNEALTRAVVLEGRLLDIQKRREDSMKRIREEYADIQKKTEDLRKSIADARSGGLEFSLDEAARGERGTSRGQRDARRVLELEARNRRNFDLMNRAEERGDARISKQYRDRIERNTTKAMELRGGIMGLRSEDRDPAKVFEDAFKEAAKQRDKLIEEVKKL